MAEQALEMYCRMGNVQGTALRLANVYGPGPHGRCADRGVLNTMIRRALSGKPLTVYGSGEWLRDYIFIDDVNNAFIAALENKRAVNGQHWIVASGESYTIHDAFHLIADRRVVRAAAPCRSISRCMPWIARPSLSSSRRAGPPPAPAIPLRS